MASILELQNLINNTDNTNTATNTLAKTPETTPINKEIYSGLDTETGEGVASLPDYLGGGSYNKSQSGEIKSNTGDRINNYDLRTYLRSGRPRLTTEVDHVIPLWAGGRNSLSNLEPLSIWDHEKKTKAQTIPLVLKTYGKMDDAEALRIATTWKDRNIDDIKLNKNGLLLNKKGEIDNGEYAQKIYNKWLEDENDLSVGVSDITKELPGAIRDVGDATQKFLDDWVGVGSSNLFRGAYDAFTLGYGKESDLKYKDKYENTVKINNFLGNIAGTVASFYTLGRVLGGVGAGLSAIPKFGSLAGRVVNATRGTGTLGKILSDAPKVVFDAKKGKYLTQVINKTKSALKMAGLTATHGQLAKQSEVTSRSERLLYDIANGALLGSSGQTLKGYAGLGLGTYTLASMEGATPEDALISASTMMALHGTGQFSESLKGKGIKKTAEELATRKAFEMRSEYDGVKTKTLSEYQSIKSKSKEELRKKLEKEDVEIQKDIDNQLKNGWIDTEQHKILTKRKEASTEQLLNGRLSKETTVTDQVKSLFKLNSEQKILQTRLTENTPAELDAFLKKNPEFSSNKLVIKEGDAKGLLTPQDYVPVTGISEKISKKTADNQKKFMEAVKKKETPNRVFIIDTPEIGSTIRRVNKAITEKEVTQKLNKPYENPSKNASVFGLIDGKPVLLGWVARKFRINESKYNINNNARQSDGTINPNRRYYNPEFNKNTIIDTMRKNGQRVLVAKADKMIPNTRKSGESFMDLKIERQDWINSVEGYKNVDIKNAKLTPEENVEMAAVSTGKRKKELVEKLQNENNLPAHDLLKKTDVGETIPKIITTDFLEVFNKALKAKTPKEAYEIINKNMGEVITLEDAKIMLEKKYEITVADVFAKIKENKSKLNSSGKERFKLAGSLGLDANFLNSKLGSIFPDLKILTPLNKDVKRTGLEATEGKGNKKISDKEQKIVEAREKVSASESKDFSMLYQVYKEAIDSVGGGKQANLTLNKEQFTNKVLSVLENLKKERYNKNVINDVYDSLLKYTEDLTNSKFSYQSGEMSKLDSEKETRGLLQSNEDLFINQRIASKEKEVGRKLTEAEKIKLERENLPATENQINAVENMFNRKFNEKERNNLTQKDIDDYFLNFSESKNEATNAQYRVLEALTKKKPSKLTKKEAREEIKKVSKTMDNDFLDILEGKKSFFDEIYKKTGKVPEGRSDVKTQIDEQNMAVKKFGNQVKDNIKKFEKDSYANSYYKTIDDAMTVLFGKNWDYNKTINPYFKSSGKKSEYFWDKLFSTEGGEVSGTSNKTVQRKEVIKKLSDLMEKEGKSYAELSKEQKAKIFKRLKTNEKISEYLTDNKKDVKELTKEEKEKLIKKLKKEVYNDEKSKSIEDDIQESLKEYQESFSSRISENYAKSEEGVTQTFSDMLDSENIANLLKFDNLHLGLRKQEIGLEPTKLDGFSDGRSFISALLTEYNKNAGVKFKRGMNKEDWVEIKNSIMEGRDVDVKNITKKGRALRNAIKKKKQGK